MFEKLKIYYLKFAERVSAPFYIITSLIIFKILFQIIILQSGFKWLSADDYCRTVISYDWLNDPKIYAGVWLSLHFWINALFIAIFKDLFLSALLANTLFSILSVIYLFLLVKKVFNTVIAYLSCIIFIIFPFQVWLSSSGLPESIYFFFIIAACYHTILWYENACVTGNEKSSIRNLILAAVYLNFADLLRYEGWIFSINFIILVTLLSFKKFRFSYKAFVSTLISFSSLISALWWLYQNQVDHDNMFYFAEETTKIFTGLGSPGFWQRLVQYPGFILYIAPLTTILGVRKMYRTLINKRNGWEGNFSFIRIFLFFNVGQLLFLMLSGLLGSGGTNMISRYIVINSILLFPFAMWQIYDLRKRIAMPVFVIICILNIIWSFYYPNAYREDTYEVAALTKRLNEINYFEPDDKIYFEHIEGYFDIYPLQVVSNTPSRFISDTIPAYFPAEPPSTKKSVRTRNIEEQQTLNILELRKFLEAKKIKLFIARSDLLIDKLNKLSYKSEQIGDYRLFYVSGNKLKFRKDDGGGGTENQNTSFEFTPEIVSFDKKLVLKEFFIDNSNLGLNPQTTTLRWTVADISLFENIIQSEQGFDRYQVKLELCSDYNDSCVYDVKANIFSERNAEEYFETQELKTILILKPFASLNYSLPALKRRPSPFMGGIYSLKLKVIDTENENTMLVYRGDSIFTDELVLSDSANADTSRTIQRKMAREKVKFKEHYMKDPYYPLGKIIAVFPDTDYNEMIRRSKDLSQIISRNGFMLIFSQRYTGDHFLNWIFNYF